MHSNRFSSLLRFVSCLFLTGKAIALTENFTLSNKAISPDGFSKLSTLVNGVFPGPLLAAFNDEPFHINVFNNLSSPLYDTVSSIHWHGLFQKHTTWADGPAFVNQCPIIPKESFSYDFTAQGQTGTYWYHSHYALQYCDGLRGPLVIYDRNDPLRYLYDYDNASTVITLSDWYHIPAAQIQGAAMADATLINGLGRWSGNLTAPLAVVNVVQGKRYRLRLVSMACEPAYNFTIDYHNFTVIEADGVETQPLVVDSVQIFSAQRYSLVLHANQPISNYWMRAQPNIGMNTTFNGGMNSAILRYQGAPVAEPPNRTTSFIAPLLETNLHPLIPDPVPGGRQPGDVTKALNLTFGLNLTGDPMFTINNYSFVPPEKPVLFQILSGASSAQDLMPSGSIYKIPGKGSSIEITMNGGVIGGPHPIHIHGHNFHVIRSAGSSVYNYDNPVIRDTVSTGNNINDVTVIRFKADNPGPWFLHCHIDFHLNIGFAAVLVEDIGDIPSSNPIPPEWDQLCPAYWNYIAINNQTVPHYNASGMFD